jgi:sialidase-1
MQFDFANFDRFVETSLAAGTRDHIEAWSPLVQPHSERSVIAYTDTNTGQSRRLALPAGSDNYKAVWGRFARAFEEHLRAKGWLDKTYLAFDEISTEVLDRVVPFFRQSAPGLKMMISGGDEKGRYAADSREFAFAYESWEHAGEVMPDIEARRRNGLRTLLYTAVNPVYPNTFIFSAPLESRYLPWIVWKWGFDGYIRWAWNFWPAALWDQPFYTWPSGDMFLVYPGPDGPVDSIRWEMLRQGMQDYECLWMARESLDALEKSGRDPQLVKRGRADIARAVALATRQFNRKEAPWAPQWARMAEARQIVNRLLVDLRRQ